MQTITVTCPRCRVSCSGVPVADAGRPCACAGHDVPPIPMEPVAGEILRNPNGKTYKVLGGAWWRHGRGWRITTRSMRDGNPFGPIRTMLLAALMR